MRTLLLLFCGLSLVVAPAFAKADEASVSYKCSMWPREKFRKGSSNTFRATYIVDFQRSRIWRSDDVVSFVHISFISDDRSEIVGNRPIGSGTKHISLKTVQDSDGRRFVQVQDEFKSLGGDVTLFLDGICEKADVR